MSYICQIWWVIFCYLNLYLAHNGYYLAYISDGIFVKPKYWGDGNQKVREVLYAPTCLKGKCERLPLLLPWSLVEPAVKQSILKLSL